MDLEERFFKVDNRLPLGLRDDIVLVIKDEPITWKIARLEIENKTPLSKQILEKLAALEII